MTLKEALEDILGELSACVCVLLEDRHAGSLIPGIKAKLDAFKEARKAEEKETPRGYCRNCGATGDCDYVRFARGEISLRDAVTH